MTVIISFDRWLNRIPVCGVDCMSVIKGFTPTTLAQVALKRNRCAELETGIPLKLVVIRKVSAVVRKPLQPLLDRRTSLTLILQIYRLCYVGHGGVSADWSKWELFFCKVFRKGSSPLFSTTWPYLPGGLRAYNFCAGSRCQINEEVFKRYQEEHQTGTAASSSTTVPSETTVR